VLSDARISRGCNGHTDRTFDVSGGQFQAMAVRTAASAFQISCQTRVLRRLLYGCVLIVSSGRGQGPLYLPLRWAQNI
jgi:hypothetical protein